MQIATRARQTKLARMFAPHRCRSLRPVAALAGLAAGLVLAADGPADPILQRRADWRSQAEKDTQPLRDQYVAVLLSLEKELAAGGDYTGAARARRERRQLTPNAAREGRAGPARPAEITADAPVELTPPAATLSGGVTFDAAVGVLTGWTSAGAAARWLLPPGLKSGGYSVELTWSCAPEAGGEVLLKEDKHTLRRTIKTTAGPDDYQTAVIGTLRLVSNSRVLEISAAAVKAPALFQLKSVRLIPVARK